MENTTTLQDTLPNNKPVVIDFEGGDLSSDAGVLLLQKVDKKLKLAERMAACLTDHREPGKIKHSLEDLLRTRSFLIAMGYEDCHDANALRYDPLFKMSLGRSPEDELGLPSQSTLSRFENGLFLNEEKQLGNRDLYRLGFVNLDLFIEQLQALPEPPSSITLDLDGVADETHGNQQLSLFSGFYDHACYVPMVVTAQVDGEKGQHFLGAILRPGNASAGKGTIALGKRILKRLRQAFPHVKIHFRLDAGFSDPEIYQWCESIEAVTFDIGFPGNQKVLALTEPLIKKTRDAYKRQWEEVKDDSEKRVLVKIQEFGEFQYQAKEWNKERRIIMKVEQNAKGENIRFVVTHRPEDQAKSPQEIYESYGGRGDMENRNKEFKIDLKAGRTSCETFKANQFRLFLHGASYILFQEIQQMIREEKEGKVLGNAQVGTLRVKLLKVAAWVGESVRRVWVRLSSHFSLKDLFVKLYTRLQAEAVY